MAEIVQMFLFLYKSKYRRKGQWRRSRRGVDDGGIAAVHDRDQPRSRRCRRDRDEHGAITITAVPWAPFLLWAVLACWVVHVGAAGASSSSLSLPTTTDCDPDTCVNGECVNDTCVCREGWQGTHCQFCGGKVR